MSRLILLKLAGIAPDVRPPELERTVPERIEPERKESLCGNCVYARILRGHSGEERVLCGYDYHLHSPEFVVRECSSYRDRNARRVAGFVNSSN
jgi:hypothetical protein